MCTNKNNSVFTLVGVFVLLFAIQLSANNPTTVDDCYIRADIEPDQQERAFRSVSAYQTEEGLAPWTNLSATNSSDSDIAQLTLAPNAVSETAIFNSFYADIQEGSTIHGIQLKITGFGTHSGMIEEENIRFYYDGQPIGTNLAGKSNIANPWKTASSSWDYGFEFSDWGIDWTREMLRSDLLSVRVQLSNSDDEEIIEAYIDNIEIVVHYTELYTLCSHACVVLYNDEVVNADKYIWDVPEGVKFLNNDPEHNVVNLDFSNSAAGILDVNLGIVVGTDTTYCSRQVYHTICTDASVGDFVWFDENFDGIQDDDEVGLGGIPITLWNPYAEEIESTTTAADGSYVFNDVPKGFYYLSLDGSGFVVSPSDGGDEDLDSDLLSNFETAIFYLDGGDSIVNYDFGLFDEGSIEGIVWDECEEDGIFNDGDLLKANVLIELWLNNNLIQTTETDTDGAYNFEGLLPGNYTVRVISDDAVGQLNASNTQGIQNVFINNEVTFNIAPGEDKTAIDAGLNPKSAFSFMVFLDENGDGDMSADENIFEGIEAVLMKDNQVLDTTLVSDGRISFEELDHEDFTIRLQIDGDYSILSAEGFEVEQDGSSYLISDFYVNCRIDVNYNLLFGAPSASIGNFVWYDANFNGLQDADEVGIADVVVTLVNATGTVISTTTTSDNGEYLFADLDAGQYGLVFTYDNANRTLTDYNIDADLGSKGQSINDVFVAGPINLILGADQSNWDIGFKDKFGSVSDKVWIDANKDGLQDADEIGLADVEVRIINLDGNLVASTKTDEQGYYNVEVPAGEYYAEFLHEVYKDFTIYDFAADPNNNSDVDPNLGATDIFTVVGDETRKDIDAGYLPRTSIIGDFVFLDLNANGIQDDDEIGLKNFMVEVFTENGTLVASTITDDAGKYELEIEAGTYYLKFSKDHFDEIAPSLNADLEKNSDMTGQFGLGTTDLITLDAYDVRSDIDAGWLTVQTLIGDYVWLDYITNGIQDDTEYGQGNILVNLIKIGEGVIGTEITADGFNGDRGFYSFSVDQPGEYYLQFILPDASWSFTESDILDDNLDSDVSAANGVGTTEIFEIEIGVDKMDMDAGMIGVSSIIGDYVWRDDNNNGLQDASEGGINGMNVFLYDEFFNYLDVTITTYNQESGHDGYYEFPEIEEGNYILVFDAEEEFATANVGSNSDIDSDVTSEYVNGSTGVVTIDANSQMFNIDAGVRNPDVGTTAQLGDMVWEDLNHNGIYESPEKGVPGVYIELVDKFDAVVASTETDANGNYGFSNIGVGEYAIFVEVPDDFELTIPDNSFDDHTDSDVKENGKSNYFVIAGGTAIDNVDVGLVPSDGILGGTVWLDTEENGMMDAEEAHIAEVEVILYDAQGQYVDMQTTNAEGEYKFTNLLVGSYYLEFLINDPYQFSMFDSNFDDQMVDNSFGTGTTNFINLAMYDGFYAESNAGLIMDAELTEIAIQFEAAPNENGHNLLVWTSSMAEMSQHFIVERQAMGDVWKQIGTVLVRDDVQFDYIDYDAMFVNTHVAYRITQVNLDGSAITSRTIWILRGTNQNLDLFPNPARSNTTLRFELENDETVSVGLYNIEGRLISQVIPESEMKAGEYQKTINVQGLGVGTYIMKYKSNSETRIQKLIID